jgi:hypothetical protein
VVELWPTVLFGQGISGGIGEAPKFGQSPTDLGAFLKSKGYFAVPMTLTKLGHLDIEVTVNGQKLLMILDTGAGGVVIDTTVAQRLKLPIQKTNKLNAGIGGTVPLEKATVDRIAIGSCESRIEAIVSDLSAVNAERKKVGTQPCDGLLGYPFLKLHGGVVDYNSGALFLMGPVASVASVYDYPPIFEKVNISINRTLKENQMSFNLVVKLLDDKPLFVTNAAYQQVESGMSYQQAATCLGGTLPRAKLVAGYTGSLIFLQANHRIDLIFQNGKVTAKASSNLE